MDTDGSAGLEILAAGSRPEIGYPDWLTASGTVPDGNNPRKGH